MLPVCAPVLPELPPVLPTESAPVVVPELLVAAGPVGSVLVAAVAAVLVVAAAPVVPAVESAGVPVLLVIPGLVTAESVVPLELLEDEPALVAEPVPPSSHAATTSRPSPNAPARRTRDVSPAIAEIFA